MATVYRKNDRWYVGYTDGTGHRRLVRTDARTKAEARAYGDELERKATRQRLGLEELPTDTTMTLAELCEWWLKNRCPPDREYNERKRLQRHVLDAPLGKLPLRHVKPADIEDQFRRMAATGLKPTTINGLRGTLHTVYSRARKAGVWTGPNLVKDVESRKVPRKVHATLRAEEVPLVLPHVPDEWRTLFATALYTGMRKGELFGLRKRDVDLATGTLTIARSYDKETTKGGHADIIPIAKPLVPYLRAAMAASPSELLFPDAQGRMRSPEADPQKVLRHALARAGLVEGYEHVCRRCKAQGKPHTERHPDTASRTCPACGMKLWPRALPRPMRFHDLRHTTATLLLRAGVPLQHVQRILRHRDVKLTADTYGHLEVEDLRTAVDTLPDAPIIDAEFTVHPPEVGPAPHGFAPLRTDSATRPLPPGEPQKNEGRGSEDFSKDSAPFEWSGRQDLNLRPLGPEPSALPG
jgi:integrase